jgi:demethylmenaquinone methyltransferase/2-methoxy-6-polyprenyl-1,4-benzoquinol methylase
LISRPYQEADVMGMKKSVWTTPEKEKGGRPDPGGGDKVKVYFGFQRVRAREKTRLVRDHFNTVAQKYDLMNTLLSFGIHYLWKRVAVKQLGLGAGDSVIDVCGGTGDLSVLAVKKLGPSGTVVLYDINRAMIETGRNKSTHAAARKAIRYVQGDAERLSFRSESFDAALVGFGMRNVTHMEEGFREMYRILKPGGRFICLEFSRPTAPWFRRLYDFYSFAVMPLLGVLVAGSRQAYTYLPESIRMFPSPAELAALLEKIGFQHVTYRALTNGIAVVHKGIKKESP